MCDRWILYGEMWEAGKLTILTKLIQGRNKVCEIHFWIATNQPVQIDARVQIYLIFKVPWTAIEGIWFLALKNILQMQHKAENQ